MNPETQVRNLESALLTRARTLVQEHLAKGASEKARILGECGQRLRLREEREILAAKQDAERLLRQQVQAAEIRMQGDLDRLRWTLVQAVLGETKRRLADLARDERSYLPVLKAWLARGAALVGGAELVAELNARDHQRLAKSWEAFAREVCPERRVTLAPAPCAAAGGVIVRTPDDRVRVDNTFEGRIERLEQTIQGTILERLFASVPDMGTLFHG